MLKLTQDLNGKPACCTASREDLCAAVQYLRDNFLTYMGPFVIKSGIATFKVSDYFLTADELVRLHKSGQLTEEGLSRCMKKLDAGDQGFTLQRTR
jgi:hypothetical protein